MKHSREMSEAELDAAVMDLTQRCSEVMGRCDTALFGAVLGNLLGMYLWTFEARQREKMTKAVVALSKSLLARMPPEAPADLRGD